MLISIVIATWNASRTLKSCLDSIVPQLTAETELIIIDGGSTDATNEIIRSYGSSVTYTISEKDKGIYDAWNKGIKVAKGNWIAFVGADDRLYPNSIANYLSALSKTPDIHSYDYICANNDFVNEKDEVLRVIGNPASWNLMRKKNAIAHVASLHNKAHLFEAIGYYDLTYKISADYELLLRKKEKLKYLYLPYHIAMMKTGGMSFSIAALREVYDIRKKHRTVPVFVNMILFLWDVFLFKTFSFRKTLKTIFRG